MQSGSLAMIATHHTLPQKTPKFMSNQRIDPIAHLLEWHTKHLAAPPTAPEFTPTYALARPRRMTATLPPGAPTPYAATVLAAIDAVYKHWRSWLVTPGAPLRSTLNADLFLSALYALWLQTNNFPAGPFTAGWLRANIDTAQMWQLLLQRHGHSLGTAEGHERPFWPRPSRLADGGEPVGVLGGVRGRALAHRGVEMGRVMSERAQAGRKRRGTIKRCSTMFELAELYRVERAKNERERNW
ncbi:hypothetical protein EDC01DRAFT_217909 [Geopyxis carbonaria]|nr:hypothetical protein EDC01DRAFT_217909 [Geopyxis carbonaria]